MNNRGPFAEMSCEVYSARRILCGASGIAAEKDHAREEECGGYAGEQLNRVAIRGLRGGWGGARGVEALGAALGVGGDCSRCEHDEQQYRRHNGGKTNRIRLAVRNQNP